MAGHKKKIKFTPKAKMADGRWIAYPNMRTFRTMKRNGYARWAHQVDVMNRALNIDRKDKDDLWEYLLTQRVKLQWGIQLYMRHSTITHRIIDELNETISQVR